MLRAMCSPLERLRTLRYRKPEFSGAKNLTRFNQLVLKPNGVVFYGYSIDSRLN
jgi:hypothetical protein